MSALLKMQTSPVCTVIRPLAQLSPLIIASPHSGRDYSTEFLASSRLDPRTLRRSEDSFVDELFEAAPALGAPLLHAAFPRAFCDVNRERWELDPDMFAEPLPDFCNTESRRVAAGFGTIARVVSSGETIYRRKLRFEEARARIETCWEPYHAALGGLIETTLSCFGRCVLIDCHSMPGDQPARNGELARFVLGDAHGTSCSPAIVQIVEERLRHDGYTVRRNDPYSGGFVTHHYGRPQAGVHVLQVEIARSLYMDERRHAKRPGFAPLRETINGLIAVLVNSLQSDGSLMSPPG